MSNSCCSESNCDCSDITPNKMCQQCRPANAFDVRVIMKQVASPTHICTCCGRVADDPDNLCSPLVLEK